jgi:serine/threonine-protein kinase
MCTHDGSVLQTEEPPEAALVGRQIDGKYRLDAFLSRGGMGVVYRATHVMLGKPVALKIIKSELVSSPDVVGRFQREARAASVLTHPNIVSIYDLGQTEDGMLYIAMELVDGPTLKEVIQREGPMGPQRIDRILQPVLSALALAHGQRIIHRDLKPQNIMMARGPDGGDVPKLVDFGIAKTFAEATQLTATGIAVGTPQYMSPEQASCLDVDGRSDLYSLGIILYEMLIAEVPFPDPSTPAVLMKHVTEVPAPPSRKRADLSIPPAIEAIALKCLEKNPNDRFQTAEEISAALRAATEAVPALASAPALLRPPAVPPRVGDQSRPRSGAGPPALAADAPTLQPTPARTGPSPSAAVPPLPAATVIKRPPPGHAGSDLPASRTSGSLRMIAAAALVLLVALTAFGGYRYVSQTAQPGAPTAAADGGVGRTVDPGYIPPTQPGGVDSGDDGAPGAQAARETPAETARVQMARPAETARLQMAREPSPDPVIESARQSRGRAVDQRAEEGRAAPRDERSAPFVPAPAASDGGQSLSPAPATPTPAPSVQRPELPSVHIECSGALEICGSLRAALEESLRRSGYPLVVSGARADIAIVAEAAVLDERVEQQFGATTATRTYRVDVRAAVPRTDEVAPIAVSRTFSFDSRFGRERGEEQARLITAAILEQLREHWNRRRG